MVHKFELNGYYIVLDVYSGAIHSVDKLVYDILDTYPDLPVGQYTAGLVEEASQEIQLLVEKGLLFTPDSFQNFEKGHSVTKALCLHLAHGCNLKCRYCFAGEGEYGGTRALMPEDVGKQAIDFIISASGGRRNLEIDFFGGEPLLNVKAMKEIVAYARLQESVFHKTFRFTLTTNGMLLDDDLQQYINENMHNVVLSLDGRKEVNDSMRGCSYDVLVPRFLKMAESRKQRNYYIRGTFTRENLDFCEDVLHLANLGFEQISVEPVVAPPGASYALQESDLPAIFSEYDKLAHKMLSRKEFNFFHFMIDLEGGPCVAKRLTGCGAGTEYLAVTPEGDLFPCHQFVGTNHFKMGNIWTGVTNNEAVSQFKNCHVYTKDNCHQCFAKFYCSGGCAANAYQANNSLLKPDKLACAMQKKRTECAIMLKVAESTKQS